MPLNLGAAAISSLKLGTATPSKVMLGDTQVWPDVPQVPWTPLDIPALTGWWDSRDNTTIDIVPTTTRVSAWRGKGPVARTASQGTTARQYNVTTVNGKQMMACTFDQLMTFAPATTISVANTAFFVANVLNDAADPNAGVGDSRRQGTLIGGNVPGAFQLRAQLSGANTAVGLLANFVVGIASASFPTGATPTDIFGYGLNATQSSIYYNGVPSVIQGGYAETNPQSQLTATYTNELPGYREELNGQLGEIVLVNDLLSQADRQRLEGYLAHGWNIAAALPTNHPYKAAPPTRPA